MSNPWFLIPFSIGTLAFFITLYITMFVPNMSDTPWGKDDSEENHPLKKWDVVVSRVMWGGWGIAMVMHALDRAKYLDHIERFFS